MKSNRNLADLVNMEQGTIGRAIFVDEEIYKLELERIFSRSWLFVGHESMIKKPDDFVTSRMGGDSVILTRDRQSRIHVLLNTCMHRGMKLCRYDQGNTRAFTCPYHGWSYSTDGQIVEIPGELVGVPGFATHYKSQLEKSKWGLVRVPRVVNYKGAIFANWDENAPDFEDYLGGMKLYLDAALDYRDGRPGGSEMIGGIQKWRVKCNWKFPAENFIGDLYHDISHRSVDVTGIGPSQGKGRRDRSPVRRLTVGFPGLGHGGLATLPHYGEPDYAPSFTNHPEVQDYLREVYQARARNLGDRMRVALSTGTIFPNMSFHGRQPRTITVFHPISSTEMEMWRIFLVDEDAPQAFKDACRHYFIRYSGPGGMTESDDMENWAYATDASAGPYARQFPYNYQMVLGLAEPIPEIPGAVQCGEYSEENARIFYARWLDVMTTEGPVSLPAVEKIGA